MMDHLWGESKFNIIIRKTGEGRLSLTDGSTYFGLFEFDEINGVGYLTRPNKQDLYARWENGILKEVITG